MNRILEVRPLQPVASLEEVAAMVEGLAINPSYGRVCVVQQSDGKWYIALILQNELKAQKKRFKRVSSA